MEVKATERALEGGVLWEMDEKVVWRDYGAIHEIIGWIAAELNRE